MAFVRRVVFVAIAAILLFGCGGATTIGDDPTDPESCTDDTASIGFNAPPGFSASMDLVSINDCFTRSNYSAKAQTTVIAGPPFTGDPSQPPDPTLKVWMYLSYQFALSEFLAEPARRPRHRAGVDHRAGPDVLSRLRHERRAAAVHLVSAALRSRDAGRQRALLSRDQRSSRRPPGQALPVRAVFERSAGHLVVKRAPALKRIRSPFGRR